MNQQLDESLSYQTELRKLALRLVDSLDELKKPFIIEFSGTPKAGKTLCVEAISKFFRRQEISVFIVAERSSVCPIPNKKDPAFNIWTGATIIAELLEALERHVKIVIFDRGIFDSLVWMNLHRSRKTLSAEEYNILESLFLRRRFTETIGIVAALSVEPQTALQREFKDQITDLQGSIMNPQMLSGYNSSLISCIERYRNEFHRIIHIDTTSLKTVDGVARIAFEVLNTVDQLVDEEIAVVERGIVQKFMSEGSVLTGENTGFLYELVKNTKWIRRTEAESNSQFVQLVPVATIRKNGEILLLHSRGRQGRMANHTLVWTGGHVRKSDVRIDYGRSTFRDCLIRELMEELKLPKNLDNLARHPHAIIWDNTNTRSAQHLAIFYEYDGDVSPEALHLREHYESPSKSLFTEFKPLDKSLMELPDWESWSVMYLSRIHNIKFPVGERQATFL